MARWAYRRRDTAMLQARRLEAAELLRGGVRPADVAQRLGVSRAAVHHWQAKLETAGLVGLRAIPRRGRPSRSGREMFGRLSLLLGSSPEDWGINAREWTLTSIRAALERRWAVPYSRSAIWRILRARGFRWAKPPRPVASGSPLSPLATGSRPPRWAHGLTIFPPRLAPPSRRRRARR